MVINHEYWPQLIWHISSHFGPVSSSWSFPLNLGRNSEIGPTIEIFGRWEFTERMTEAVLPKLVGGAITILKNDGVKVNGKDDIPYMKWKIKHVWNHQPGNVQQTMAMIFYCEPFYQLASLGRIRLAGLPEKINIPKSNQIARWLDSIECGPQRQQKHSKKFEKQKNYSNIWRNDSVYCNQLEDPNQLGWSSCSRQNGRVRLVVFSPVFHTQRNQTLVIYPNIPMKYYPFMRPNWWLVPVTR